LIKKSGLDYLFWPL